MSKPENISLIPCASGLAGVDIRTGQGPLVIQNSAYFTPLKSHFTWETVIEPQQNDLPLLLRIQAVNQSLAKTISRLVKEKKFFVVLGGDHSCAIGTWSGAYDAIYQKGDLGLIWLDAHMDSHTPDTSETGRIHGMPCASLLGHGPKELTQILHQQPKIKPENVFLIGLRSYESGEAALLEKLHVRTYMMDEVKQRGFEVVLQEAVNQVKKNTINFGVSLDLDCIDPPEVPGVDVPEPDGVAANAIKQGLFTIAKDPKLIGLEIVEFDPARDRDHITEKLVIDYLATIEQARIGMH